MLVPFKWAGNKKTLLTTIQEVYSASGCTKIIEPFCGSAIFSLNTEADTIEISDTNNQLIDLWLDLKNHWEELNSILNKIDLIEISKVQEKYILLRKSYNKCSRGVLKSALLYVLLGGCTNNLARWNSAGEFNQTWGNRRAIPEDYLVIELRDKIGAANFNIFCRPYGEINPDKNTFVYLDPPYLLSNDCYTANSWDLESEESLLAWIKTLKCKWALSNIITKNDKTNTLLQNFGKEYNLINLTKKYNAKVGGYKKGVKNNSQEVLITNFEFNHSKEFLDMLEPKFAEEVSKQTCPASSGESKVEVLNSAPIKKEEYTFNKSDWSVKEIDQNINEWFLKKHYAHRVPNIIHSFGLYQKENLEGVMTFGMTANNSLNNLLKNYKCLELNRLVTNENLPKNALSFFVSSALKLLPEPLTIISYADSGQGHHGYIYQATNWLYTGMGKGDYEFIKDGRQYHRKNIYDLLGTGSLKNAEEHGYQVVKVAPKHRYLIFLGNHKQKKEMKEALKWEILPYPKGDNNKYDASYKIQNLNMNKKGIIKKLDVVNDSPCDFSQCKQNKEGVCTTDNIQDCPKNNSQSVYEDESLLKPDGGCKKEKLENKKIKAYYSE